MPSEKFLGPLPTGGYFNALFLVFDRFAATQALQDSVAA